MKTSHRICESLMVRKTNEAYNKMHEGLFELALLLAITERSDPELDEAYKHLHDAFMSFTELCATKKDTAKPMSETLN